MKKLPRTICCALMLGCLTTGVVLAESTRMGEKLYEFLKQADQQDLALNPQAAVLRGDLKHAGEFGDLISDAYFKEAEALLRRQLQAFSAIDRRALNATERTAYDVFKYQSEYALRQYTQGISQMQRQLPIDHLFGQHIAFQQFSSGMAAPFATLKDYEDGLSRINGFVLFLDRAIVRMREGIRAGRTQPRVISEKVLQQLNEALATPAEKSPFYQPLLNIPKEITATDAQRLQAGYRSAITEKIYPTYTRLRDFMQKEYLPASRTGAPGIGSIKGGKALYEYLTESFTTVTMKADEIHELGLNEVARIRKAMEALKLEVGYKGTLAEFFKFLQDDAQFKPKTKAEYFSSYEKVGEQVERLMPKLFKHTPKSKLEIQAVPAEQESSAAGAYYIVGTPDGKRPGVFYLNTSKLETRTSPRKTALYLHEAVPGHHYQGSLAQEDESLPPILQFGSSTAYIEGWALYCEWLGYEMGVYADAYQRFGQLDMEMFRASRLVVDTGLHAKGWSREQAINYMLDNTSLDRTAIEQEVDRYIVWPGQATAYKIGDIKIRELRKLAEAALGKRFDVREFHDQVLNTGALPLQVLELKIRDWIAAQKKAQ